MLQVIQYLTMLKVLTICYQFYRFTLYHKGKERQVKCQTLGIVFSTLGILGLVFHHIPMVTGGLILIMLGFRLIAHGLDRIDKSIFIDRYDNPEE